MTVWRTSPNLALDEWVNRRRAEGASIVHLGFGESRLPVFAPLVEHLMAGAGANAYGPVAGTLAAREAVAGYFTRRRLPTHADQVVLAPGSKPILSAIQHVVPGDCLLPVPCWNSYAPQVRLAGGTPIGVPIPSECGGVPAPAALREAIRSARARGLDPRILVLTLPDNPTGTLAPPVLVRELCTIAEEADLLIVSDEIYRDVVHDPATELLSPAEVAPHRTVVTAGLSKSLALGGWRIGVGRFPDDARGAEIRAGVVGVASEVWSNLAAPMQEVARYAYTDPPEIRERLAASARLHGAVARAVHTIVVGAGARCRPPTGAFYVYPDFEPAREALAMVGVTDARSLQRRLLDEFAVAVLAGDALGDDPRALRCKISTSMLYGDTPEQQEQALACADPVRLAHVAELLARIEDTFTRLCVARRPAAVR
ncbi:pyridoxal phosphate-dependent aminotransferase [Embleya sp. AB8]|uniref:pyridoxal phosphate-dependent aminotransferase n=1 Tax=Embleya sp. AB8 TaxID=3156304 RepID=UPI003C723F8E